MTKIKDLKAGDLVDLEGDKYADPNHDNVTYVFEYSIVAAVTLETADCMAVDFEDGNCVGFPPDHEVKAIKEASP